ncbi:MAG: cytidine deaminase [Bryobacteraceae bacterium]|nr:cytidine deaminase [Bryobacteraceae bacterium]
MTLLDSARDARSRAIATYSNYRVGAALLAADGSIYTGANIENATYGLTMCAERVALYRALHEGAREFVAIAVAAEGLVTPCGACRQLLWEFCGDIDVVLDGRTMKLGDLLPDAFDRRNLR